jgi:hypothetical protein
MKAWGVLLQPPRLPTYTTRAVGAAWATISGETRSSTSSSVAFWMALSALMVSSSGSPGPAPTRVQRPVVRGVVAMVMVGSLRSGLRNWRCSAVRYCTCWAIGAGTGWRSASTFSI